MNWNFYSSARPWTFGPGQTKQTVIAAAWFQPSENQEQKRILESTKKQTPAELYFCIYYRNCILFWSSVNWGDTYPHLTLVPINENNVYALKLDLDKLSHVQ